ncbi:MAG: antitoxin [Candidatus Omnitrophica bacterium CG11_big_fil_rev_8_21_14_0_20_64_10]|nr:MAG: antitoxin [Candidatus Omnitrophica bacterium CG11_big_fil_rev_8_21_14_0_20_64_10]
MIKTEDYVSADPEVCHGKPCFKGTRIMVASVLELFEGGQSTRQILEAYPGLTPQHIQAALHLASELLDNEQFISFRRSA